MLYHVHRPPEPTVRRARDREALVAGAVDGERMAAGRGVAQLNLSTPLGSSKTVRQYVTHDKFMKNRFLASRRNPKGFSIYI